jgi:hypothetical protein
MTRGWQSGWHGEPPPQMQLWWWAPGAGPGPQRPAAEVATAAPTTPVRIGDAERDKAVSDLGDHFAAGRLSREEFDERADQAMQARFSTDLDPLFTDLPKTAAAPQQSWAPPRQAGGPPPWAYAMWLLPLVAIAAVVGGIFFHAPFLLWALIWVTVILKVTGHKRRHRREQLSRPGPR